MNGPAENANVAQVLVEVALPANNEWDAPHPVLSPEQSFDSPVAQGAGTQPDPGALQPPGAEATIPDASALGQPVPLPPAPLPRELVPNDVSASRHLNSSDQSAAQKQSASPATAQVAEVATARDADGDFHDLPTLPTAQPAVEQPNLDPCEFPQPVLAPEQPLGSAAVQLGVAQPEPGAPPPRGAGAAFQDISAVEQPIAPQPGPAAQELVPGELPASAHLNKLELPAAQQLPVSPAPAQATDAALEADTACDVTDPQPLPTTALPESQPAPTRPADAPAQAVVAPVPPPTPPPQGRAPMTGGLTAGPHLSAHQIGPRSLFGPFLEATTRYFAEAAARLRGDTGRTLEDIAADHARRVEQLVAHQDHVVEDWLSRLRSVELTIGAMRGLPRDLRDLETSVRAHATRARDSDDEARRLRQHLDTLDSRMSALETQVRQLQQIGQRLDIVERQTTAIVNRAVLDANRGSLIASSDADLGHDVLYNRYLNLRQQQFDPLVRRLAEAADPALRARVGCVLADLIFEADLVDGQQGVGRLLDALCRRLPELHYAAVSQCMPQCTELRQTGHDLAQAMAAARPRAELVFVRSATFDSYVHEAYRGCSSNYTAVVTATFFPGYRIAGESDLRAKVVVVTREAADP